MLMKRIATPIVSLVVLLAISGCKHKDNPPPTAASTTPTLARSAVTPGAVSAVPAVKDFEGEIGLLASGKFADKDEPLMLTLRVKSGKARLDLPESLTQARGFGPAFLLLQPVDKKAYAVLEARKQAVLIDIDQLAEQSRAFGVHPQPNSAAAPKPARLEKTGKSETVAGIPCDLWRFSQGKAGGEACIAEQETTWLQLPNAPAQLSWLTPIADGKHLPLRFVSTERNVERGRIEVTRVQRESLAASLFELPADYAIVSLEQMVASMLGGLGGPRIPPGMKLPPGIKPPAAKGPTGH